MDGMGFFSNDYMDGMEWDISKSIMVDVDCNLPNHFFIIVCVDILHNCYNCCRFCCCRCDYIWKTLLTLLTSFHDVQAHLLTI